MFEHFFLEDNWKTYLNTLVSSSSASSTANSVMNSPYEGVSWKCFWMTPGKIGGLSFKPTTWVTTSM